MRTYATLIFALTLLLAGCGGYDRELLGDPQPAPAPVAAQESYAETDPAAEEGVEQLIHTPSDYDMFGELSPYGSWYETTEYGVVWQPVVTVGWQPFTYGHWIWTSYGWMWVSYEPFGWATYHYGNWWLDPVMGWIWVPNYTWAACPVDWFMAGDYMGWAPLPPPGCSWNDPWVDQGRYKDGWVVVETGKFKEVDVGENRVKPERFKSAYRTGTAVRGAPDTRAIERATRQSVKETDIRIDSERYGTRELRKVVLPSHEQQIVERFPMPISSPIQATGLKPVNDGGTQVTPPPGSGKTKGSTPPPATTKDTPQKFKSKDSKGSTGTSRAKGGASNDGKDSGDKSKDNGSKDNGSSDKPKDDKKDSGGSSPAKAKGKKG
ncbi:MAG: hypothetical protein OEY32_12675 [Candidatus Krumholzibacteria bacterium]|nr:hypothetical protein [Candidatus Krumholzibacteria bacterium]